MTKLMLAGIAALALSTGAAFAATPRFDAGSTTAPVQHVQVPQRYEFLSQQRANAPRYTMPNSDMQDSTGIVSFPVFKWEGP